MLPTILFYSLLCILLSVFALAGIAGCVKSGFFALKRLVIDLLAAQTAQFPVQRAFADAQGLCQCGIIARIVLLQLLQIMLFQLIQWHQRQAGRQSSHGCRPRGDVSLRQLEMLRFNQVAVTQQDGALDAVAQLADIARKRLAGEPVAGAVRELQWPLWAELLQ